MKFCKKLTIISLAAVITLTAVFYNVMLGGSREYNDIIKKYSDRFGVDYYLVLAVAKTESGFVENAVSKKGAVGLMQLLPTTAQFIATKIGFLGEIDLYNSETNVCLGVAYLKYLEGRFNGDERLSIIAYNCGEGVVKQWLEFGIINDIPYSETRKYVKKVICRAKLYKIIL